jgi:hypothetical protein
VNRNNERIYVKEWGVDSSGQQVKGMDYVFIVEVLEGLGRDFDLRSWVLCDLRRAGCTGGGQKKGAS